MHIGFIMDGNRRWATMRNLAKSLGHNAGVRALENTLELCVKNDIKYVSFWALAKKNIEERTKMELDHIYFLLVSELANLTPKMVKNGVKFETVGDTELLPDEVVNAIKSAKESTKHGTKTTCILAIGYGWQEEIIRAVRSAMQAGLDPKKLDEKSLLPYLDSGRFPAPDLIVRTGGDVRHSGYFLYQSEYSEYYFTDTYWPDFGEEEFYKALNSLKTAQRNFGK